MEDESKSDVFCDPDVTFDQQLLKLFSINSLLLNEHLRQLIENGTVVHKNLGGALVGAVHEFRHFLVDGGCGVFGEIALCRDDRQRGL